MRILCRGVVCSLLAFSPAPAQERPLECSFSVGATSSYRVQLTVRSELEGQQTERIGSKTYVKPLARAVERGLSWTVTRRVTSLGADGAAEIEETLSDFAAVDSNSSSPVGEEAEKLSKALQEALAGWGSSRVLHYRETRAGQLQKLKLEGAPPLEEASPPLLTLWLLRALRPAAALPQRPIRFGDPWQEPRAAQFPNWSEARGVETGEWLAAMEASEPAARLHVVQQVLGTVTAGPEKPPEGNSQARFHGESLNTISLADGGLLAATRSAAREVTWTLAPVEGLKEPPQFRAKLSVEVRIESCYETPCLSSGRSAVRQH